MNELAWHRTKLMQDVLMPNFPIFFFIVSSPGHPPPFETLSLKNNLLVQVNPQLPW